MNGDAAPDSTTLALTGALPFVLLVGAALALVVSLLLLRLYRRAVLRSMSLTGGKGSTPPPAAATAAPPPVALRVTVLEGTAGEMGTAALREAMAAQLRAAFGYAGAGAVFAAIMTAAWLAATSDDSIGLTKPLFMFWTYFWPAALSANLVAGSSPALRRRVVFAYFAVLAALIALGLLRNPQLGWHQLPLFWLLTEGPPTVLLLAFLARPIRAVGPLVLTFTVAAVAGSAITLSLLGASEAGTRAAVELAALFGLGGSEAFWGVALAGFLAFAVLAWLLIGWLGRRYEAKRLSDESLTLDAMWLFFGIVQSFGLAFEGALWVASGLVAFLAYKLAAAAGHAWLRRTKHGAPARTLLLLRVFALGRRSEQLFDALRKHWLRIGSMSLIAGPDLATSTVEPHEFLGFVSGRLSRQFVKDEADLARRVGALDLKPDPDGRHRVNEFFCHADTWQSTMRRLVAGSDAVLMDLRSFSPSNRGCVYELGQLVDAIDLSRVVFLIDATTDRPFLEQTLQALWQRLAADSPNRRLAAPAATLVTVDSPSPSNLRRLLGQLLGAPPTEHSGNG